MGNTENMNYRIALYERLSKEDGDKEESESIKNQSDLLNTFVEELKVKETNNTFVIIDEYIDDGYTGTNFDRPRLSENARRYGKRHYQFSYC